MIGKRVPPNSDGWIDGILKPGEYAKVTNPRAIGHRAYEWHACTPNGAYCNLGNHEVVEHEDGTITVSPSIKVSTSRDGGKTMIELWHGFLEHGVWRSC